MASKIEFYKLQIERYTKELAVVKQHLFISSMLRLGLFVIAGLGVYLFFSETNVLIFILLITFTLFLFLVSRHTDLQAKKDKTKALIGINENEVRILAREFYHLADGREFKDPSHEYSQDLDLFGRGSFYQYSNRTCLQQGSEVYASLLTSNNIGDILSKQQAVKELSEIPEWRQQFSAIATLVKTETSYSKIIRWMDGYLPFTTQNHRYAPYIFSAMSALIIATYFLGWISGYIFIGWFILGLMITGRYLKKITKLAADCAKIQSTFQQYQALLLKIEEKTFTSDLLREKRATVFENDIAASLHMRSFARLLSGLDQRNNMIIGLFGNAFMLRDIQMCYAIEQWIAIHGKIVASWFSTIAYFDAYNTLGNFAFNHEQYAFPTLQDGSSVLKVKSAAHPMLDPEKSVKNDFEINTEQFFIVTGANMAGKSTFLRTVSLHIVMANAGLPVCASSVQYKPVKLITSMRTTDSLTDEESYFFSELKRLKFIVDRLEQHRYFIVLDEILKGTNSTDKAKGSRRFIDKLVASKSTGIIATHDLSLCQAAEAYEQVKNYYFDAQIKNGELHFDYKFKEGVCVNMNASFLLKKMGIVD